MKVIHIDRLKGTDREVFFTGGISLRPVIELDNVGFSLHKTIIPKGGWNHWHYKNHLEACYCITGYGYLKNLKTGKQHFIEPNMCYILDEHDDHEFKAMTEIILISVFNPPLKGHEVHDKNGNYE